MKITCQACQAKYTIADEKVVGKVVKIRCKKCGASIVVNGNDPSAVASQRPPIEGKVDPIVPEQNRESPWTVNVADGDQRTMTETEIASGYAAGIITDETFCWKEGMTDWLPVQEIAPLQAACAAQRSNDRQERGPAARISNPGVEPVGAGPEVARPARPSKPGPIKEGNGSLAGPQPAANVASRRTAGRGVDADLFGSVAQAGGEQDVLTSAPAGVPEMHDDGRAAVARNDLFALNDKGGGAQPPSMTATSEASGLIDIRQLSAQMRSSTEEKKKSRVDDIMNLGGGGAFSPSLSAPILTAPSLEAYSQPPPPMVGAVGAGGSQARSKALIFLALGVGTFFLVAAIGIAVMLVRGRGPLAEDGARTGTSGAEGTAAAGRSVSTSQPAGPSATGPRGVAAPEGTAATPQETASAPKELPAKDTKETVAPKEAAPKEYKEPKIATPVTTKEAPAVGAPAAEFNMGEARSRLASIAAGVQSCKRGDTAGAGKVEIVFAPSGAVQSASLISGSPFDGTPTGKCIEARFKGAHVPAFGGSPFTVTKSFSIN